MITFPKTCRPEAVLYSGGIDSSILIASLVARGVFTVPIYIQNGFHWQTAERNWAQQFLVTLNQDLVSPIVDLALPLDDVYGKHWSIQGEGVPSQDSPDQEVDLPGRNATAILKAALWCRRHHVERLSIGVLGTSPFADTKEDFFEQVEKLANIGTGNLIEIVAPFADWSKDRVMRAGEQLKLEKTFSCLAPRKNLHCGVCNKCRERQDAFSLSLDDDPTEYANH